MVPGTPEDDLETLMTVKPTPDDMVSLVLLTKVVATERTDDVEFKRSRVAEEFETDMVAEYDGEASVWFGTIPTLSDLMMSAA